MHMYIYIYTHLYIHIHTHVYTWKKWGLGYSGDIINEDVAGMQWRYSGDRMGRQSDIIRIYQDIPGISWNQESFKFTAVRDGGPSS